MRCDEVNVCVSKASSLPYVTQVRPGRDQTVPGGFVVQVYSDADGDRKVEMTRCGTVEEFDGHLASLASEYEKCRGGAAVEAVAEVAVEQEPGPESEKLPVKRPRRVGKG